MSDQNPELKEAQEALKKETASRKAAEKKQLETEAKLQKAEDANAKLTEGKKKLEAKLAEPQPDSEKEYSDALIKLRQDKQNISQKTEKIDALMKKFLNDFTKIVKE